jgi:CSLREA domain-containing protein
MHMRDVHHPHECAISSLLGELCFLVKEASVNLLHRFMIKAVGLIMLLAGSIFVIQPGSVAYADTVITVTDMNDFPGTNGLCALREAIDNANSDSDTTSGDCSAGSGTDTIVFSTSGSILLGAPLPAITSSMVIDGTGYTIIIDGRNNHRVFEVQTGGSLTLNLVTVLNGYQVSNNGGGIYNNGTLSISNSIVSNSHAVYGGGVYNDSAGTATVANNSVINGNSALRGGGVYNQGNLLVDASTISNNTVPDCGGGIWNSGTLVIQNASTIGSGNTAGFGGGVYNSGSLTVTSSTVINNTANVNLGGGIFNDTGGVAAVTGATIQGNHSYSGGGIYNNGTMTVQGASQIYSNLVNYDGAGIYNYKDGTLTIDGSTVAYNQGTYGGGIFNGGTMNIQNATSIVNNLANLYGGGIHNGGGYESLNGTLNIENSNIENNQTSYIGGGILNASGSITITKSTLLSNSALSSGGGIYNGGSATISNSTFFENFGNSGTGGIDNQNTLLITNSTFVENNGIVDNLSNAGSATLRNSILFTQSGTNCSGTITDGGNNLAWDDTTCPGLHADPRITVLGDHGGPTKTIGLIWGGPGIDAANDAYCPATDQRGIARPQGSHCDIGAYERSGALLVVNTLSDADVNSDGKCSLREAIIAAQTDADHNECAGTGYRDDTITFSVSGTIALQSALPDIIPGYGDLGIDGSGQNIVFSGDSDGDGSGNVRVFRVMTNATFGLSGLTLTKGNASNGGAILNSAKLNLTNVTVSESTATYGGAIYNDGGDLAIRTSTIRDSTAYQGGGIYHNGTSLFISSSSVSGNTAADLGGGIYAEYSMNIIDSVINTNIANNGGGIYGLFYTIIDNSTVSANIATTSGGGIYNAYWVILLNNSIIGGANAGNSATDGGGIYNTKTISVVTGTISHNTAANNGGGIYLAHTIFDDPSTLNPAIISNNTANNYGGGIYTAGSLVIANGSLIGGAGAGNSAGLGGGVYVAPLGNVGIQASTISANSAVSGAGIYNTATVNITNRSTIGGSGAGNIASEYGGGIYNMSSTTVDASTVSANSAIGGGGLYNFGTLTIQNGSSIGKAGAGNTANYGGGIYNTNGSLVVDFSKIRANNALYNGGGIFNDSTLTIQHYSDIGWLGAGNSAALGGGIYNSANGIISMENGMFLYNIASGNGDAVYNDSATFNAVSVILSCIVENDDIAIYNNQTAFQQATKNWWGHASGPGGAGGGLGDTVGANVDFDDFLFTPILGCPNKTVYDPPVITEGISSTVIMDEDSSPIAFDLTLHATDLDPLDVLNWNLTSAAQHGIAAVSGSGTSRLVNYTPDTDYFGSDNFVVLVSDGTWLDTITVYVSILAANDPPSSITLSSTSVPGNMLVGTLVGRMTSTDVDSIDPFVYSLVPGSGDLDNSAFAIEGNQLLTAAIFDHNLRSNYSIRIRTMDSVGSFFEKAVIITITENNYTPTLLLPAQGIDLLNNRPTFDWLDVPGASSYIIQISKNSSFTLLVSSATVIPSTFTPAADLPANLPLYWRVKINKSGLVGPWSIVRGLKTANPPSVPLLVSPRNGAVAIEINLRLDWSQSTTPNGTTFDHYELWLDDNAAFSSPTIVNKPGISNHEYLIRDLRSLPANSTFYWRVRAYNTDGEYSNWSSVFTFRTFTGRGGGTPMPAEGPGERR